jgi:hypothetical protein
MERIATYIDRTSNWPERETAGQVKQTARTSLWTLEVGSSTLPISNVNDSVLALPLTIVRGYVTGQISNKFD